MAEFGCTGPWQHNFNPARFCWENLFFAVYITVLYTGNYGFCGQFGWFLLQVFSYEAIRTLNHFDTVSGLAFEIDVAKTLWAPCDTLSYTWSAWQRENPRIFHPRSEIPEVFMDGSLEKSSKSMGTFQVSHVWAYGWKTEPAFACFYEFHGVKGVGWGGVGWGGLITFICIHDGTLL